MLHTIMRSETYVQSSGRATDNPADDIDEMAERGNSEWHPHTFRADPVYTDDTSHNRTQETRRRRLPGHRKQCTQAEEQEYVFPSQLPYMDYSG